LLTAVKHKIKREQYGLLFRVADRRKTGRVSLADWANFENLLAKPDAEYEIAFRLFDVRGEGAIRFPEFKKLYDLNKADDALPFDWNSEWASLYTGGRNKRHEMNYHQFSQMLRGLQGERVRQAFQHFDKNGDGYIEPEEFQQIIIGTAKHKLSDHVLENLHTLCNISPTSKISYANVRAFQNILREMDLIDFIVNQAAEKSADRRITRTDFLNEAARITRFTLFTPMEADILFHFAGMNGNDLAGRLGLADFAKVLDASWQVPEALRLTGQAVSKEEPTEGRMKRLMGDVLESAHHFVLGSVAGAFGAFMVYPIDLVKTRMQNQRSGPRVGTLLYKNSMDCAIKVFRNEGIRGLYSGVLPQMVGVAPEKAIKLTVNDLVRGKLTDESGKIWWGSELAAGGAAGGCQVVSLSFISLIYSTPAVRSNLEAARPMKGKPSMHPPIQTCTSARMLRCIGL
jgi:solute carrier family 25 aspartate/glutamate transporter 12/13